MSEAIEDTLAQRDSRYGSFDEHARITQSLKDAMANSRNWATLSANKKEALEMVQHKIGRILNGDPEYHDSWHDIIGYTKLVADTLITPTTATKQGERMDYETGALPTIRWWTDNPRKKPVLQRLERGLRYVDGEAYPYQRWVNVELVIEEK